MSKAVLASLGPAGNSLLCLSFFVFNCRGEATIIESRVSLAAEVAIPVYRAFVLIYAMFVFHFVSVRTEFVLNLSIAARKAFNF